MFGRSKRSKQDKATRDLQSQGVYSLGHPSHPYVVDRATSDAVKEKRLYGFWSGFWYVSILSMLLFWIPPFGQMIAGYVGGRKAGTPRKGFAAALMPMSVLFLLFVLLRLGFMEDEIGWLFGLPLAGTSYLAVNVPVVGPLVEFMIQYIQAFVNSIGLSSFFIAPYVLTVIFGYVGGILSLQHQREMGAEGSPPLTPIVPMAQPIQQVQPVQQVQPQPAGQEQIPLIMGKKPDGWDMKKDKKKGKWK